MNRTRSLSPCQRLPRVLFLSLATTATGGGCATRGSLPPTADTQPAAVELGLATRSVDPVMPTIFQHGAVVYDLSVTSTVQSIAGDSLPRTDSSRISAVVSGFFTPLTDRATRADIRVDSIRVFASGSITELPGVLHTFQMRIGPNRHLLLQRPDLPMVCMLEQPTILTGEEILPTIPPASTIPQSWSDTTHFALCRGGIRLSVTRIAEYRRAPAPFPEETGPVHIIRLARTVFEGQGTQWQQPVQTTGKSTTVDTLVLTSSRLLSSSGETHLDLVFRSQFRAQEFRQVSHTQLRLQN